MSDKNPQLKKVFYVGGISILIYAYLTFIPLGKSIPQLTTDLMATLAYMMGQLEEFPLSIRTILTDLILFFGGTLSVLSPLVW